MKIFAKKQRSGAVKTDREVIQPEERKYISENIELNIDVQKKKYTEDIKKMINQQLENLKGLPNRAAAMAAFEWSLGI